MEKEEEEREEEMEKNNTRKWRRKMRGEKWNLRMERLVKLRNSV